LPRIFERLHFGSGIGFSVAKAIIEAQGGKIWVDAGRGDGTAVKFTVPVYGVRLNQRLSRAH